MRRRVAIAGILLFALLVLPPFINLRRYQTQIENTISGSIGRDVSFSAVHLRLLPQPGFVFENFVVAEDPDFGMEPVLRADQVVASLRLTSLWRGRLEIARLTLDAASVNLVRDQRGLWNFGSPLRQASTVPSTPTAAKPGPVARFPYIEATATRVNFKFGVIKQAFSLVESEFSLWQETGNRWEMRLEARPMRTDASLTDTGLIEAQASFTREHNEGVEALPLRARARWRSAPLGQVTWLLTGRDRGWRGELDLRAELEGTPSKLAVRSQAALRGFRRYDIGVDPLNADLSCDAQISRTSTEGNMFFAADSFACKLPLAAGSITASGSASWAQRDLMVTLEGQAVPVRSVMEFYRRAILNVSESLRAGGSADFLLRFDRHAPCPEGSIMLRDLRFIDDEQSVDLRVGTFQMQAPAAPMRNRACLSSSAAPVSLGAASPVVLSAEWTPSALAVRLSGPAESEKLLSAVKSFGLIARDYHAQGLLDVSATVLVRGPGFAYPAWTGSVTSRELKIPQGTSLTNVVLEFTGDTVRIKNFQAVLPELDTTVSGSIAWPIRCAAPPCALQYALRASRLDVDLLNKAFNPALRKRNWLYLPAFLGGSDRASSAVPLLFAFDGAGTLRADKLVMRKLVIDDFSAAASWRGTRVWLNNIAGNALGGRVEGRATLDLHESLAASGELTARDVDASASGWFLGVPIVRGKATISGDFSIRGTQMAEIARSAQAEIGFTVVNGSLRRFANGADLAFRTWSGKGLLKDRTLSLTSSRLVTAQDEFALSGALQPDFSLSIIAQGKRSGFSVTGSAAEPTVTPHPVRQYAASNPLDGEQKQSQR